MLKAMVFDLDLKLIFKIKDLLNSFDTFYEIQVANTPEAAISFIKSEVFDVLILGIPDEKFKAQILKVNPKIVAVPVLALRSKVDLKDFQKFINYDFTDQFKIVPFLSHLSQLVDFRQKELNNALENYYPVKSWVVKKLTKTPCDLFFRLNSERFLKLVNAHDIIESDFIERYEKKGINEFFLQKADFYEYSDFFFSSILPSTDKYKAKEDYFSDSLQVIKEIVSEIGINENTINLATELVDSAVLEYSDVSLTDMLNRFKYSENRYIYDHGLLTSIFALAMCEKFEWRNQENMKKMVFSAIFHDFGFSDQKLAFFDQNLNQSNLRKEQKDEILNHTSTLVEMLSKNKMISSEVLSVIGKHHEGRGDESYPNKISAINLSIFECVFIVAHEFTNELYKIAFRHDKIHKAVENISRFCQSGNLKLVKPAFMSVISDRFAGYDRSEVEKT